MATPHKARLTALHAICVQIFRHIAQKYLAIRQYACGIFRQSDEKFDDASVAQSPPDGFARHLRAKLCAVLPYHFTDPSR